MTNFWKATLIAVMMVGVPLLGLLNFSTTKSRQECSLKDESPRKLSLKLEFYRPWVLWADFDGFILVMSDGVESLHHFELDTDARIAVLRAGPKLLPSGEYLLDSERLIIKNANEQFEADCITL